MRIHQPDVVVPFSRQGGSAVLLEYQWSGERWLAKVPRQGVGGAEHAVIRELIFAWLATELGLPLPPISVVRLSAGQLRGHPVSMVVGGHFSASKVIKLGRRARFDDLPPVLMHKLVIHEALTSAGLGDRARPEGPRDTFHREDGKGFVVLDFEGLPHFWDDALAGREPPLPVDDLRDALLGRADGLRSALHDAEVVLASEHAWRVPIELADFLAKADELKRVRHALSLRAARLRTFLR